MLPRTVNETGGGYQQDQARQSTLRGRLTAITRAGGVVHAGGGGVREKGFEIEEREMPAAVPSQAKCGDVTRRMKEEAQIALIPPKVIFVPGDEEGPPTREGTCDKPIIGCWDVYAAIGVAHTEQKGVIWVLQLPEDKTLGMGGGVEEGPELLDLRDQEGREKAGLREGSKAAEQAMARHEAHVYGRVQPSDYLVWQKEGTDDGGQETPDAGPGNFVVQWPSIDSGPAGRQSTAHLRRGDREGEGGGRHGGH